MAAIYKITENLYEETFALIALHSSLEDHSLVYALNLYLGASFKRCTADLDVTPNVSFPVFEWNDEMQQRNWTVIANTSSVAHNSEQDGLFRNESIYQLHHLIPEYKEVDYFLKIEQDEMELEEETLENILTIPKVVTAYSVAVDNLKSKNNLIF